jgi:hypothetical protein
MTQDAQFWNHLELIVLATLFLHDSTLKLQ